MNELLVNFKEAVDLMESRVYNGLEITKYPSESNPFKNVHEMITALYEEDNRYETTLVNKANGRKRKQVTGGSRSFPDILKMARTYFPGIKTSEVFEAIQEVKVRSWGGTSVLQAGYCPNVRKVVHSKSRNNLHNMEVRSCSGMGVPYNELSRITKEYDSITNKTKELE